MVLVGVHELSKKQRCFVLPECHDMPWLSPPGIGEFKRCFTGLLEHSTGIVLRFSHRRVDIWHMTYDIDWLVVSCKVVSVNLYKSVNTQPIRSIIYLGFVHPGTTTVRWDDPLNGQQSATWCHRQCCDSPRISRRRRSWAKTTANDIPAMKMVVYPWKIVGYIMIIMLYGLTILGLQWSQCHMKYPQSNKGPQNE